MTTKERRSNLQHYLSCARYLRNLIIFPASFSPSTITVSFLGIVLILLADSANGKCNTTKSEILAKYN